MGRYKAQFEITRQYSAEIEAKTQEEAEKEAEKLAEKGGFIEGTAPTVDGCEDEDITVMNVEEMDE